MGHGALNMFHYSNDEQETWYKNATVIVRKRRMKPPAPLPPPPGRDVVPELEMP